MNYKDILAMAEAYSKVAKKEASDTQMGTITVKTDAERKARAQAYRDKKAATNEAMDPVDTKELKGKHKDRKDKDIDNDGDVDKSDEYLHKRRKAVSASIKGKKKDQEVETEVQEMTKAQKRALQNIKAQPKDKVSLKKAPWDMKKEEVELDENKAIIKIYQDMKAQGKKDHNILDYIGSMPKYKRMSRDQMAKVIGDAKRKGIFKEEVELDEATATVKQQKALKALMTKALDGKRAKPGTTSAIATNGDFVVKDSGSRIIGRLKAGTYTDPLKETVEEAKDHGNTNNGSPAGEGLSPSAKKELDRTTPMNPATDAEAVNNINFKTFKAMSKKAAMRSNDNAQGDKTPPKAGK